MSLPLIPAASHCRVEESAMTTERQAGREDERGLPAAGGSGLRTLVTAAWIAALGFAVGSWARPSVVEAMPEPAFVGVGDDQGCAAGLPPGHPPVETLMGLPPGHPPIRARPRLPAGHPPIPSAPPPVFTAPPQQAFTI